MSVRFCCWPVEPGALLSLLTWSWRVPRTGPILVAATRPAFMPFLFLMWLNDTPSPSRNEGGDVVAVKGDCHQSLVPTTLFSFLPGIYSPHVVQPGINSCRALKPIPRPLGWLESQFCVTYHSYGRGLRIFTTPLPTKKQKEMEETRQWLMF